MEPGEIGEIQPGPLPIPELQGPRREREPARASTDVPEVAESIQDAIRRRAAEPKLAGHVGGRTPGTWPPERADDRQTTGE